MASRRAKSRERGREGANERAIAVESFEKVRSSGPVVRAPSPSPSLVSPLRGHRDAENETSGKRGSKRDGRTDGRECECERAIDRGNCTGKEADNAFYLSLSLFRRLKHVKFS